MYKAVVIGCGSIGALKPDQYDRIGLGNALTIAHAFYRRCADTDLVAVCDINISRVESAGEKWNCKKYIDFRYMINTEKPDIVAVCVPTENHYEVLHHLVSYRPKLVIAEKPFCLTEKEARKIMDKYRQAGIPLMINYTRRYLNAIQQIKNDLDKIPSSEIYHARAIYGKSLEHEGCHALDLFHYLFGKMLQVDYVSQDLSSIKLRFEKCQNVELINIDANKYSIFDIDIFTGNGRINLTHHGIYNDVYSIVMEDTYGYYPNLSNTCVRNKTDLTVGLSRVINNAVDILNSTRSLPHCTPEHAVYVHYMINEIMLYMKYRYPTFNARRAIHGLPLIEGGRL